VSGDAAAMHEAHRRWLGNANRRTDDPDYQEAWYFEQCGGCRFWLPLAGPSDEDHGSARMHCRHSTARPDSNMMDAISWRTGG
jgi:hypothetical protein